MRCWSFWLANAFVAFGILAAEELPAPDPDQPLEIEPPLLIGNRAPDGSLVVGKTETAPELDLARLESHLARARRSAASGDRLYRGGIIAKVEAEERVLKVTRLEAKLAQAKLQRAREQAEENAGAEGKAAAVAAAEKIAAQAAETRQRAEVEAALRNLQRQQKLLALGSARKADVNRAARKLAELQAPKD